MNDFLKQDIFFFITTIAVIIVTVLMAILIIYIIKISKNVKYISEKAKTEADLIAEDISNLRTNVKEHGMKAKHLFDFFSSMAKKAKKK